MKWRGWRIWNATAYTDQAAIRLIESAGPRFTRPAVSYSRGVWLSAMASGRLSFRYFQCFLAAAAATAMAAIAVSCAQAQPAPGRPVTLIVPFPAGGGVDAVARIVAERMAAHLGQQVIIDNRGGVAGVIGMRVAAKAAPDGTTIVMSHTASPRSIRRSMPIPAMTRSGTSPRSASSPRRRSC
jgi:hypothetical protein